MDMNNKYAKCKHCGSEEYNYIGTKKLVSGEIKKRCQCKDCARTFYENWSDKE